MRTKYHRNGDVTLWDIYVQQWIRCALEHRIAEEIYASLPESERVRVQKHRAKHAQEVTQ